MSWQPAKRQAPFKLKQVTKPLDKSKLLNYMMAESSLRTVTTTVVEQH